MSGFSSVSSGLSVPLTRQSTSTHNLANLSTPGFQAGRVNAVSQPSTGTRIGSVSRSQEPGFLHRTGRPMDLAIRGDGYFVIRDGDQTQFTRSGSFTIDEEGRVVHSTSGGNLQARNGNGGLEDVQIPGRAPGNEGTAGDLRGFSFDREGRVLGAYGDGRTEVLANVALATFQNPGGLKPRGQTLFNRTINAGDPNVGAPGTGSRGTLVSGALESSNVDLAGELVDQMTNQHTLEANLEAVRTEDEIVGELLDLLG